jgi:hypothetical protein
MLAITINLCRKIVNQHSYLDTEPAGDKVYLLHDMSIPIVPTRSEECLSPDKRPRQIETASKFSQLSEQRP